MVNTKPKIKIKNDSFKKMNLMTIKKCPLKNIIREPSLLSQINDNVIIVNKIIIQFYQFLKLYLIREFDNDNQDTIINDIFIKSIFRIITKRKSRRGPLANATKLLLTKLKVFYDTEYKKCIRDEDVIDNTKLQFIMTYEANDIIKNLKNNISEHFIDYVNKFVNISFDVETKIEEIKKLKLDKKETKKKVSELRAEFRKIKKDLLRLNSTYGSDPQYHDWINLHRPNIIKKLKFDKNSIYYDVCSNPFDYLKSLFYLNRELEKISDQNIKDNKEQIKLFQVIPQRTSIKPKYITIDTSGLINLTVTKNIMDYLKNVTECQEELWNDYFKLNRKEFKRKDYKFNFMIKTDGIACSILMIKLKDGKPIHINSNIQKKIKKQMDSQDKYIEDIEITDEIRHKKIITIDPGHDDLIYCLSKNVRPKKLTRKGKMIENNDISIFRYTQNQRRLESRNKKYNKIQDHINKTTVINDKTVKEIESTLTAYNSKTSDYEKFMNYCREKNNINRILFEHYAQYVFRKLKFNRYTNTQKSESKMIKNFKNKFGDPKKCIIVMGDYSKKDNMRGKEPCICKKFRKIFRDNNYELYMIDEFNTSKLCNKCCSECENFLMRESHKPKNYNKITKKGKLMECWGLVRCTNDKCKLIHNRDKNSSLNMNKIVENIIFGNGRPKEYCRDTINEE